MLANFFVENFSLSLPIFFLLFGSRFARLMERRMPISSFPSDLKRVIGGIVGYFRIKEKWIPCGTQLPVSNSRTMSSKDDTKHLMADG